MPHHQKQENKSVPFYSFTVAAQVVYEPVPVLNAFSKNLIVNSIGTDIYINDSEDLKSLRSMRSEEDLW